MNLVVVMSGIKNGNPNLPNSRITPWLPTELYGLAAFRKRLVGLLADKRIAAQLKADAPRHFQIDHGDWSNGLDVAAGDPELPSHFTQPMRACDFYAYTIAKHAGAPAFALYWPLAKRDAAIAAQLAWLASLSTPDRRP